ncbi:MAG: exodeoxyribonuclease VII large subunit [Deltaproteobacteria bacterium]|nr:exodeoxyribonuclease VII large subunit [Deltaproteobacteria bacterium]MBW1963753.1 exodeoxyribonuclease VII large subunit [Deltaproteobacteria bacterium]MBW2079454.1 exodeoxyribonuclease VII large subunit [Deltaproteobacteria bacterium]
MGQTLLTSFNPPILQITMSDDSIKNLFPPSALEGVISPDIKQIIPSSARHVWQISDLLAKVQDRLDLDFDILWVEGEISNLRQPSSGHCYFTLKDNRSQIKAVLFKSQAARLPFDLKDGHYVICFGRLNIYTGRGDLQLVVETVEPKGEGALQLAFEQLMARLEKEGLFSSEHKLPLPLLPQRVFVITSPTGAAIHDFIRNAKKRYPGASIVLCPASVQGEWASGEIVDSLRIAQHVAEKGDVILLTRGGGSLEDLWAFNDETLAWGIFNCSIPVVSAVGHEVDFTISDFVADHRAATPTAAAQLLFPHREELIDKVTILTRRIVFSIYNRLKINQQAVQLLRYQLKDPRRKLVEQRFRQDDLNARLLGVMREKIGLWTHEYLNLRERFVCHEPGRQLAMAKAESCSLSRRLVRAGSVSIERKRQTLGTLSGKLNAVSPLAILARGYSLVYRISGGELVKRADQLAEGERLLIRPEKGAILCKVLSTGENQDKVLSETD